MTKLRKFARITIAAGLGLAVIGMLAAVGFEVLKRQLPSYQDEIRAWVTAELGIELDYTRFNAALSWRGPELAFGDVRVRTAGDPTPFLTARGASVGFSGFQSLLRLVSGRQ